MNKIIINLHKDSDTILGKMLSRGYRLDKPFECSMGLVGNVKMALTSIKKEGVPRSLISKTRISKKDIEHVSLLKDRELNEFDFIIYDVLLNRILTDFKCFKILETVLKNNDEVIFTSNDKSGKEFKNMKMYIDTLNRIVNEIKINNFDIESILFKHKYQNLAIIEKIKHLI